MAEDNYEQMAYVAAFTLSAYRYRTYCTVPYLPVVTSAARIHCRTLVSFPIRILNIINLGSVPILVYLFNLLPESFFRFV